MRYAVVSIISGVLFGFMDGLLNANTLAQKLLAIYKPIARTSINITAGFAIDIAYGFAMAGFFLLLYRSLPGSTGLAKGLFYALMLWFFRVVMHALGQWMTIALSWQAVAYLLVSGILEMAVLGMLYGLALAPRLTE